MGGVTGNYNRPMGAVLLRGYLRVLINGHFGAPSWCSLSLYKKIWCFAPRNTLRKKMASYKIKKGDTLSAIAKANGTTVDALVKANNIKNKNLIVTGKSLTIPGKSNKANVPAAATRAADKPKKSGTPAAVSGRKVQTTPSKPKGTSVGGSGKVTATGRDGQKYSADYGTKPIKLGPLPSVPKGAVTTRAGAVEAGKNAKFNYGSKPITITQSKPKPTRKPTAQEIATAKLRAGGK